MGVLRCDYCGKRIENGDTACVINLAAICISDEVVMHGDCALTWDAHLRVEHGVHLSPRSVEEVWRGAAS